MAPRQKSRERYERSRPKCSEDTVLLAARGVDLQVARAGGRRVSCAVPDLQHNGASVGNTDEEFVGATARFEIVDDTPHERHRDLRCRVAGVTLNDSSPMKVNDVNIDSR